MAFKMKADKQGPMKKNFPGAFKKEDVNKKEKLDEVVLNHLNIPFGDQPVLKTWNEFLTNLKKHLIITRLAQ